jgi:conjugative relaxase-like TrwC/TraI family protein
MLSIEWITGVDYYLKKKRKRRGSDAPEDGDDPDDPEDGSGLDYYFDIGEGFGEWWGSGAKALGLSGTVQAADLKALCQGFGPDGTPLIQNAGAEDHQQAWDLTYSAPKSVSVLWSQVDSTTRARIQELHRRAIDAALSYLAEVAILTRRGKGGVILEHALPIVAIFDDTISRELDPQLHSHCLLLNVAGRSDETFGTILSKPFFRHKLTAGAIYQTELAHLLRSELGLRIVQDATAFRVVGVPEKLVDFYSTRAKQIRRKLQSEGYHSPKAAAVAALDTRKEKPEIPPPFNELLERWQQTNRQFGFTQHKAHRLLGKSDFWLNIDTLEKRIAAAMHELLKGESYFSEQELIRQVARAIMAEGISAKNLIDLVRAFLVQNPQIVPLAAVEREPLFTTKEILTIEAGLLASVDAGKTSKSHVVPKQVVERILNDKLPLHTGLSEDERIRNEEQRKAVHQVTAKSGDIQVIEGMAGTGKTYTLNVARQVWSKAGYRVVGLALSAAAAANLKRGAQIESETIALRLLQLKGGFASHHKQQLKRFFAGKRTYAYRGSSFRLDRKTVVVVDEAGMVGTRQLAELVKHVKKAGAKLVLVGDRRQLQPIDGGGPFAAIANRTVPAELRHVIRQQIEPYDPNPTWHRQAGQLIANGHIALALKLYSERGRLNVLPERDQAMLSLVRDWSVRGMANPTDHVVLAGTREEVKTLNHMCQSARRAAGFLGNVGVAIGDQAICLGDQILFTQNACTLGINNGDRGRVIAFSPFRSRMTVELEHTKKKVIVNYREYTHCQLGYAMTTHKAQGATVPSVYVLLGGAMQDRHLSYVQTTRACESTRLYVDKYHAGPDMKHLLSQMAKLRPKQLAHELLPKNPNGTAPPPTRSTSLNRGKVPTLQPPSVKPAPSKPNLPSQAPPRLDDEKFEKLLAQLRANQSPPKPKKSVEYKTIVTREQLKRWEADDIRTPFLSESADDQRSDKNAYQSAPPPAAIPRDILDLSHVSIGSSFDRSVLDAAVERYGRLPGGIVVEGEAVCDFPIRSLAIDPTSPGTLSINNKLRFDTGLSDEEVALLWHSILLSDNRTSDFGAVTQTKVIGIENDTLVALTMMKADNALGGLVYGFDSQFVVSRPGGQSSNAFLNEVFGLTYSSYLYPACLNYVYDFNPQVFLKVDDVQLHAESQGVVTVKSNHVQAVLGVVHSSGLVANATPACGNVDMTVEKRFPHTYNSFHTFVANFCKHARLEPSLARCLAYAEVIMLFRLAKAANARLFGHNQVRRILKDRQHYALPRYDYTQRSYEFAWRCSEVARYLARRTDSNTYQCLATAVVGFQYAALAGDSESYLVCRKAALRCLPILYRQPRDTAASIHEREMHSVLDFILDKVNMVPHDVLIPNCLEAARRPDRKPHERESYLEDALIACGSADVIQQNETTRCYWLEIKSHLDPEFEPVPGFAQIRAKDVTMRLPFAALNSINSHHRPKSRWDSTRSQVLHALDQLNSVHCSNSHERSGDTWRSLEDFARRQHFWHLGIHPNYRPSLEECLVSWQKQHSSDSGITKCLTAILAVSAIHHPPTVWSLHLLHHQNPFCDSCQLLKCETVEGLKFLFWMVRREIEQFGSADSESWWRQLLKDLAAPTGSDASIVGVLLAYEMKVRRINVGQLHARMIRHRTSNPQAALLLHDFENIA